MQIASWALSERCSYRAVSLLRRTLRGVAWLVPLFIQIGQASAQSPERAGAIVPVYIYRHGFSPSQITVPPGRILLRIKNFTASRDVRLQVDRQPSSGGGAAQRVRDVLVTGARHPDSEALDVTPGAYSIRVAGREQKSLMIMVDNR
jgi:hypothetical protein